VKEAKEKRLGTLAIWRLGHTVVFAAGSSRSFFFFGRHQHVLLSSFDGSSPRFS